MKKTRFCDPPTRTAREALRWFSAPDGVQDRRCDQINPLDDPFVGARRRSIPASRSRVTMLRRDKRGRRRRRFLHLLLRSCHDDGGPYSLRNGRPQPELSIFQRGACGGVFLVLGGLGAVLPNPAVRQDRPPPPGRRLTYWRPCFHGSQKSTDLLSFSFRSLILPPPFCPPSSPTGSARGGQLGCVILASGPPDPAECRGARRGSEARLPELKEVGWLGVL